MPRVDGRDVVFVVGLASLAGGVALLSVPAGLIVVGAVLLGLWVVSGRGLRR